MGKLHQLLVLAVFLVAVVKGFSGTDDKFVKKYAMMKIYESCFGPDVVKEIRKEMKAACMKCAAIAESSLVTPASQQQHHPASAPALRPNVDGVALQRPGDVTLPSGAAQQGTTAEGTKHGHVEHEIQENLVNQQAAGFDAEKLHQAILAYRPTPFQPQPQFRPFPGAQPFYSGYGGPGPLFYPANPGVYPQPGAFQPYSQFAAAAGPYYPQFFSHGSRMSRDMNIRDQIDALTNRMSGRVRNVTCVMQELGYLDENLEPNFEKILARIGSLPVQEELKRDMQDGVTFCQQFSQCIPETKKDKSPLSRELVKPMFFFRCYKHKKLEACIMKDVRERFSQDTDADFEALADGVRSDETRHFRSSKAMKTPFEDNDEFSGTMYDFLYGGSNVDLDSIL